MGRFVRNFVLLVAFVLVAACSQPKPSGAAPYAAHVMDARTGETLYAKNADTRLHPASLTKMMTLYIAFGAIERGEISLDSMVTISKHAAAEPPSKLGLKAGQKVALRHLIRAAAIKSANDAATAIGEAIGGSEAQFAAMMNATAKQIGMSSTTFRNANGLTTDGHLSTARDMSTLGRRLFYDFPQYYNIFSRRETDAGLADVRNTNRKFLDMYKGADGIKTGFTNAAGFNLTASAERGNVRIIATIFGGTSTAQRNAKMVELLDLGFASAPANAPTLRPEAIPNAPPPVNLDETLQDALVAEAEAAGQAVEPAKTLRIATAVSTSLRPKPRPASAMPAEAQVAAASDPAVDAIAEAVAAQVAVAAMQDGIAGALAEATGAPVPEPAVETAAAELVPTDTALAQAAPADQTAIDPESVVTLASAGAAALPEPLPFAVVEPEPEPEPAVMIIHTATPSDQVAVAEAEPEATEVVTRISTSGGRHWGVNIGRFGDHGSAERALMKTMLAESATLNAGTRKILQKSGGYDANFMGLTQEQADLACRRLQARGTPCFTIGP